LMEFPLLSPFNESDARQTTRIGSDSEHSGRAD
jgi:hypothetical protein